MGLVFSVVYEKGRHPREWGDNNCRTFIAGNDMKALHWLVKRIDYVVKEHHVNG